MATKAADVTEIKFYDVEDIMKITGRKKTVAYKLIKEINQKLKAQGKLTLNGKVLASAFNSMW